MATRMSHWETCGVCHRSHCTCASMETFLIDVGSWLWACAKEANGCKLQQRLKGTVAWKNIDCVEDEYRTYPYEYRVRPAAPTADEYLNALECALTCFDHDQFGVTADLIKDLLLRGGRTP